MRTINTSDGPKQYDPTRPGHTLNTSRVVEEDLIFEDEVPEIIAVVPGGGWQAVIGDEAVALVAFVALDSGKMHGVAIGEDGLIDLTADVEKHPNFSGYIPTKANEGETV